MGSRAGGGGLAREATAPAEHDEQRRRKRGGAWWRREWRTGVMVGALYRMARNVYTNLKHEKIGKSTTFERLNCVFLAQKDGIMFF